MASAGDSITAGPVTLCPARMSSCSYSGVSVQPSVHHTGRLPFEGGSPPDSGSSGSAGFSTGLEPVTITFVSR